MNRICPVCGSENTEDINSTEVFDYKSRKIEIPDYRKTICHTCGESVADKESVKRSIPILRDAQRTIDGLLTSNEIWAVRKSFNKTQDEFSQILGGGEKAFARYESGRVSQSKPMDNLLRILRAHPESIEVILPESSEDACTAVEKIEYSPFKHEMPFQYIVSDDIFRKIVA